MEGISLFSDLSLPHTKMSIFHHRTMEVRGQEILGSVLPSPSISQQENRSSEVHIDSEQGFPALSGLRPT